MTHSPITRGKTGPLQQWDMYEETLRYFGDDSVLRLYFEGDREPSVETSFADKRGAILGRYEGEEEPLPDVLGIDLSQFGREYGISKRQE